MSFNDVEVVFIKRNYYRIYFWYMIKNEVVGIMKNSDL